MSASPLANLVTWQMVSICCECGVEFASSVIEKRRDDGKSFYCPNGHGQYFTKTEAARLKEELERVKRDLEWAKSQSQTTQKMLTAQRGQTTKARNKLARVHKGVCPDCNRSFQNLAAHMKTKHTD